MMRQVIAQGACLVLRGAESAPTPALMPFGDQQRLSASLMFVPVHSAGAAAGVLSIQSYTPMAYSAEDLNLLQSLADLCGNALQRIKVTEALHEAEAKDRSISRTRRKGSFKPQPLAAISVPTRLWRGSLVTTRPKGSWPASRT